MVNWLRIDGLIGWLWAAAATTAAGCCVSSPEQLSAPKS
jgi:hypothetical protein